MGPLLAAFGGAGSLGTLKKSKASRYSNSLGGGYGVTETTFEALCRGCLEMRKSKSYAQRRISARILTLEGVTRSPLAATIRSESRYSSKTRLRIVQ